MKDTGKRKTISKEKLKKELEDRNSHVQVINVLERNFYELGLIPGSFRIPLSELPKRLADLDKTSEVVTYCEGYGSSAARNAAEILEEAGFNVSAYEGGLSEWRASGLKVIDFITAA